MPALSMIDEEKALKKIGERVRYLRKKAGYTSYEDFAWQHGIHRQTMYRIEKGESITLRILIPVLNGLDISLEEFFKGMK